MISPCYITFDHKGISSQDLRHNKWWLMSHCTWLESAFYTFLQNIWSLQYFGSALTFYPCSGAPGLQRLIGIINFMIGKINNFEIQKQICKLAKTCDFSWRSSWRFMMADSVHSVSFFGYKQFIHKLWYKSTNLKFKNLNVYVLIAFLLIWSSDQLETFRMCPQTDCTDEVSREVIS